MQRQLAHLVADFGEAAAFDCAEPPKKLERGVEAIDGRPLEPFEGHRIAAPGDDVERRRREIDAMHLWIAVRAQHVAPIPEAERAAGQCAPGAPAALLRRIRSDSLEHEMVD